MKKTTAKISMNKDIAPEGFLLLDGYVATSALFPQIKIFIHKKTITDQYTKTPTPKYRLSSNWTATEYSTGYSITHGSHTTRQDALNLADERLRLAGIEGITNALKGLTILNK